MQKGIREIQLSDAAAVREIYAPFVTDGATSFEMDLPPVEEFENRVRTITEQYPWLVYEADGKVLGYAYASAHRSRCAYQWSVEVSVYIRDGARRSGIGRALYRSLFEVLRRQGYVNAFAGITLPNPASVGLHESLGFQRIGVFSRIGFKFGRWHDVIWLQLRLADPVEPQAKMLPVKDVLGPEIARYFDEQSRTVNHAR